MRQFTCTQTQFEAPNSGAGDESTSSAALSQCALQITRAAIARWSGGEAPAAPLARDLQRVSPQARWLSQAQCGLADWIARGGFSQADDAPPGPTRQLTAPSMSPSMYQLPATLPGQPVHNLNACVD